MTEPPHEHHRNPGLHEASLLLRKILVLNDRVEFHTRTHLDTSETDLQAMQLLMNSGELTPTQLAERLHLSAAAVTTVIDRLVHRGHAERVPHPGDRRRTLIRPLPAAAGKVMALIRPVIERSDQVAHQLDPAAQEAVVDYLSGIIDSMEQFVLDLARRSDADQSRPDQPGQG